MLKKTAGISTVFRDKKREEVFIHKHKIGINSFTRVRKLGFDKIMTMMIKKVANQFRIVLMTHS